MARWQAETVGQMKRSGGVYAIYNSGWQLIYIGSSGNVRSRLVSHIGNVADWPDAHVKVAYMVSGWYQREQRLIRRLRPFLNRRITFNNLRDAN